MREIKYRQKLKPSLCKNYNEKFHYWGFIDNSFVSPLGKNDVVGDSEQYTGLKDKNGVEIYESDVLSFDWVYQDGREYYLNLTGVVKWVSGRFVMGFLNDSLSFDLHEINQATFERFWKETYHSSRSDYFKMVNFKVIGNIYENGDLLNDGDC